MPKESPFAFSALLALAALGLSAAQARELTFADRIAAQEAIERVYHSHQVGNDKPFEESVPKAVLKRKVVKYLKQSVALEKFWHTPVTAEILERELLRMRRDTTLPDRLRELFAALDDDPFLIQECLARATLVDRLTRNFFAYDHRFHAEAREETESLRQALAEGAIDSRAAHPFRSVIELVSESKETRRVREAPPRTGHRVGEALEGPARLAISSEQFDKWLTRLDDLSDAVRPVHEERESFVIRALLEGNEDRLLVADYRVKKSPWHEWWNAISYLLDHRAAASAAPRNAISPVGSQPGRSQSIEPPCDSDDTWVESGLEYIAMFGSHVYWTGTEVVYAGGSHTVFYDPATDTWRRLPTEGAPCLGRAVWTGDDLLFWCPPSNTMGRFDPLTDTWTTVFTEGEPSCPGDGIWARSGLVVWDAGTATGCRYDQPSNRWAGMSREGAPIPRSWHTTVWAGDRMVVWGGLSDDGSIGTGARYDPATDTWTATSMVDAPMPRWGHSAVSSGRHMLVWGGSWHNSGGRYDPVTDEWKPISQGAHVPFPRSFHSAVWTGTEMIVWGGEDHPFLALNSGGQYDPIADSWTPTSGNFSQRGRSYHSAVWTGSLMIVGGGHGGMDGHDSVPFTGSRYEPASGMWTPVSSAVAGAPAPRRGYSSLWTGSRMIVWGGRNQHLEPLDTGGSYDPATHTWSATSVENAPSPRTSHTAVWTGSVMVVRGGADGSGSPVTGGKYDPVADEWTTTSVVGAPPGGRAVWAGDQMLVWGCGSSAGGRYDPVEDSWSAMSTGGAPSSRCGHSLVWTGREMIAWGGGNWWDGTLMDSGGRYDPTTDTWTPISLTGAPLPRADHTAVWTGRLMLVWGGSHPEYLWSWTGDRYDPEMDVWTPVTWTGIPGGRNGHTAVWTGSLMVIWGGEQGYDEWIELNDGGRYDPEIDAWAETSEAGAPLPRAYHTAIWTGSHMLVWGGSAIFQPLFNTGGMYALGHSSDDDGDGLSECDGDCNDALSMTYPGAIEVCDGHDNQCPGDFSHGQIDEGCDDDGDSYCDAFMVVVGHPTVCPEGGDDCSDDDSSVYPGAPEVNDGFDNQCPGDLGHGVIDETSGRSGFRTPGDKNEYSWEPQDGATLYEVAWSVTRDFTHGCAFTVTSDTSIPTGEPLLGGVSFYLNRPFRPNLGSWGQDSLGRARVVPCRLSGGESDLWEDRGR